MPRITPTHFIEVWKDGNKSHQENIKNIIYLKLCLSATKELGAETIAIWKIKFKNL